MHADEIRQRFHSWREKHARPAWKPITSDGAPSEGSHFGGAPVLAPGEKWPACRRCGDPMQFFLQLALSHCPPPFAGPDDRLLQLFYCSRDDGSCETWAPFSGAHVVRLLAGPGDVASPPPGVPPFPARAIRGWSELIDYPDTPEQEELGLVYDYDFTRKRVSASCPELDIALPELDFGLGVAEAISVAEEGDKLGGWPMWIQGVEYPKCPQCQRRMQLVLQVDSEDNLPFMFGDAGCGHITQCPDHPEVLAFGWACS